MDDSRSQESARPRQGRDPALGTELRSTVRETSAAEWLVAALGALLVLTVVGTMLHDAATGPNTPPLIAVRVDSILPAPTGFMVRVTIMNQGDETGAGVVIEGRLRDEDHVLERSTVTLDHVPAQSNREAGLVFTADPRRYRLQVVPLGYAQP